MITRTERAYQLTFLANITFGNMGRHIAEYWRWIPTMTASSWRRSGAAIALSLPMAPMRTWERLRWGPTLRRTELAEDPVFLLGHWRSGTTHLHNLMACDPRFGFVTMLQATFPGSFLSWASLAEALVGERLPETRPMDNVTWTLDTPQEEEIALSKLVPEAFFASLVAPQRMAQRFESSILLGGVSKATKERWCAAYRKMVLKASLHAGGKRLLLKNPANTGRLDVLGEMYPNASYVFIHRNPHDVFASMRRFYASLFPILKFQEVSQAEIDDLILEGYRALMTRYLAQRERIPAGRLVELRYEDLEAAPIEQLRRIYDVLGLEGFDPAPARAHLVEVADYRKNQLELDDATCARVADAWGFAFEAFGYEL